MADPSAPLDYDYVAYIDESGDPGIRRVKPIDSPGSSEWMMVSAVVIAADREAEVTGWMADLTASMNSRQMRDIHFAKLNPARKLMACEHVARLPVRGFVVASNKQNMKGWRNPFAEAIPSDNWFYCWMTRLLLERVTHYVKRKSLREYGEVRRVKLVFSERGGLSYSQLNAYYQWLRYKGDNQVLTLGNLEYDTIHMRLLEVHNHLAHDGLKLPDIVASAFFKAADHHDTGACDPTFALALKPRMAACPAGQISGYGVKLMPGYGKLRDRTRPDQLVIFKKYGYPSQWWADGGP
ncbi:MAG: DUF3800 domain-containing protein [Pseudomonadota bacterium]